MKKKFLLTVAMVVGLTGCGILNYIPEDFDGNEYMKLAELSVITELSESCNPVELASMHYYSAVLMKYSEGTLKQNIADIYAGIHDLTVELKDRENPSDAYCKIKRKNIAERTNQAMETFGGRKK